MGMARLRPLPKFPGRIADSGAIPGAECGPYIRHGSEQRASRGQMLGPGRSRVNRRQTAAHFLFETGVQGRRSLIEKEPPCRGKKCRDRDGCGDIDLASRENRTFIVCRQGSDPR